MTDTSSPPIMDYYLLPSTVYQPPRLGQAPNLNTIIEDESSDIDPAPKHQSSRCRRLGSSSPYAVSPLEDHLTSPRFDDHHGIYSEHSPASAVSSSSSTWSAPKHGPDFDELYDVTDDEQDQIETKSPPKSMHHRSSNPLQHWQRDSAGSNGARNRYPALLIPSPRLWPNIKNHKDSPVPPTPPPKIPISPAVLSLLARHAPTTSAPPSLDGSMTSEQLANSTAPTTPNTQTNVDDPADWSSGVHLHPDALATLRALSNSPAPDDVYEVSLPPVQEMQQLPTGRSQSNSTEVLSPATQESFASLAQLDIPSPGVFFSSLGAGARHTWADSSAPLSTTTAEKFYDCPWNYPPGRPIERVVEIEENMSEGPPTARQVITPPTDGGNSTPRQGSNSPPTNSEEVQEIKSTEVVIDYDENYERELEELASSNLDRTSVWLASQTSYMSSLQNTNSPNTDGHDSRDKAKPLIKHSPNPSLSSPAKKSVHFNENAPSTPASMNQMELAKKESTYYRAFQHMARNSHHNDTFVHRLARLEALQTHRICLLEAHRNQLLGRYELNLKTRPSPARPISLMPSNIFDEAPDPTAEQKLIARVEREREALEQISASMWNIAATKFLKNGKLLASPGGPKLAQALPPLPAHAFAGANRDRARLLDLGGQATCDWGWHAAREYPNVKIYTVITKQQLNNTSIRGPHNHRRVSVPQLWRLPFRDGYFDVISARSLYTFLKTSPTPLPIPKDGDDGGTSSNDDHDEYAACLSECLRVLKPGGYLEFELFDADLVHAGPLGMAMSVEFAFNLKTRGYDPYATRSWIGRLSKAGFGGIKRAWLFLPLSRNAATPNSGQVSKQMVDGQQGLGIQKSVVQPGGGGGRDEVNGGGAVKDEEKSEVMGSTHDAASIAGLVGSLAWERWMLKLQIEMGKSEDRALEGVGAVLEEGRRKGAGWRCLTGWARKPVEGRKRGTGDGKGGRKA